MCWIVNSVDLFFTAPDSQEGVLIVNDREQMLQIIILVKMFKLVDLGLFRWKVQSKLW